MGKTRVRSDKKLYFIFIIHYFLEIFNQSLIINVKKAWLVIPPRRNLLLFWENLISFKICRWTHCVSWAQVKILKGANLRKKWGYFPKLCPFINNFWKRLPTLCNLFSFNSIFTTSFKRWCLDGNLRRFRLMHRFVPPIR